jgi:hypothetical protein
MTGARLGRWDKLGSLVEGASDTLGSSESAPLGSWLGVADGDTGASIGSPMRLIVGGGSSESAPLGSWLGISDGIVLGISDGTVLRVSDGIVLGISDGSSMTLIVGGTLLLTGTEDGFGLPRRRPRLSAKEGSSCFPWSCPAEISIDCAKSANNSQLAMTEKVISFILEWCLAA